MNFTAIDFETACSNRASICSVGIVVVENGNIVDTFYSLINPIGFDFKNINISIHGITPFMVKDAPSLAEIYPIICKYLKGDVVAHNKSFDFSCIYRVAKLYDFELPRCEINCSMELSQQVFNKGKLEEVARLIGFNFTHHNALEDAKACANIILEVATLGECKKFKDLKSLCSSESSRDFFGRCRCRESNTFTNTKETAETQVAEFFEDVKEIKQSSAKFVVTGEFDLIARKKLEEIFAEAGHTVQKAVTKQTNYVIVGNRTSVAWKDLGQKIKRAIELKEAGCEIVFMTEKNALKLFSQF